MLEVHDLGDGPSKAVVEKTTRARQLRRVEETRQELSKIKDRVTRTLDAYDLGEKLTAINEAEVERIAEEYIRQQATLEFVDDMMQLMVILSDPVAKRKLLAQLQEFFNQNAGEDDKFEVEPIGFDLEAVNQQVREALDKAQAATHRLAGMSHDVVKAIEMANPKETKKGKKKLEKALQQSQQDIISLTEKLLRVQSVVDENDSKLSQVYKSLEAKQVEIERLKIQSDNGKKNAEIVEDLRAQLLLKEDQLLQSNKVISDLELNVAHLEDKHERDLERQKRAREENQKAKDLYEDKLREQQQYVAELRQDLQAQYDAKFHQINSQHKEEIITLENKHNFETKRTSKELEIFKKKIEELKSELADSNKKSSVSADSKRVNWDLSIFSPESSEGESSSGRTSLKSSAQTIRKMLARKNDSSASSSPGPQTPQAYTPQNKTDTQEVPPTPDEASQGNTIADKPRSLGNNKRESTKNDSQPKTNKTPITVNKADESVGTVRVERVDVGVQSDTEEPSEVPQRLVSRKSSGMLETVPELETAEQPEPQEKIDWDAIPQDILMEKLKEFEDKAQEHQAKMESELVQWKNKYLTRTNALKQELEEVKRLRFTDKETLEKQLQEAVKSKELAEQEAEQALLQMEELLAEQEEMRLKDGKQMTSMRDEVTMTGVSLEDELMKRPESLDSTSRHSILSRQSSERQPSEASLHGETPVLARDSGVDAGSSAVIDSRPLSNTSHVNTLFPSVEVQEPPPSMPSVPSEAVIPEAKSQTLDAPKRRLVMSARARKRLINTALNDHPVTIETFRTYEAFLRFRMGVIQWFEEQGMGDEVDTLENLKTVHLNKDDKTQILESLPIIRGNVTELLEKLGTILSSKKLKRPSPDTRQARGEANAGVIVDTERRFSKKETNASDGGVKASSSYVKLLRDYNDLTESYEQVRQHMDEEAKFSQEQTSQNAAVMAEMQETINQLRAQLAEYTLRRSALSGRASSTIMFTRLDAERNSKILKRAINEERLSQDSLSDVISQMDAYVGLPAKRLAYISRRYQHHRAMKDIEEGLKKSASLDESVFGALDRMEDLQNQRARRWGEKMDDLAAERDRLAHLLTDTFNMIEQDTSIFLIKPVLSYKGRSNDTGGYVVSKHKALTTRPMPPFNGPVTPAPTPWLGRTSFANNLYRHPSKSSLVRAASSIPPVTELDNGAIPMDVGRAIVGPQGYVYQGPTWQAGRSQVHSSPPTTAVLAAAVTTSRVQELEVNRMMIGQNMISCGVAPTENKTDVLGASARSYVAIERPCGAKLVKQSKRPHTTGNLESPPNTPYDHKTSHSRNGVASIMHFNPLPPIRMPELRNESRSSKSMRSYAESETAIVSIAGGSPAFGDARPGTQDTVASKDASFPLTSASPGATAAR